MTFSLRRPNCKFPFPPAPTFKSIAIGNKRNSKKRGGGENFKRNTIKWTFCVVQVIFKPSALAETNNAGDEGMEIEDNAIYFLSCETHTDPEYWSTEQQLGICSEWWSCNVLRHVEIGFFSDTSTSCSWEDWSLILTCSQDKLHPVVVKADLQLAVILALSSWRLPQLLK